MARPRIYDEPRVTTAVRISPEVRDELHRIARSRDVSVNYLINRAVEEFLPTLTDLATPKAP